MKKNKKTINREILLIAILTLTIALVWVYISVYKTLNKPAEKPLLTPQETKIINPAFEKNVFEELETRKPI